MLTRSKTKHLRPQTPRSRPPPRPRKPPRRRPPPVVAVRGVVDKPKPTIEKKVTRSVRLTEDLLYIVNKKLRTMDKKSRDNTIQEFNQYSWMNPVASPFTEIAYRKRRLLYLSETELAVMHKINFDSNSIAVCKISSMSQFFASVNRGGLAAKSREYRNFLDFKDRGADARVTTAPARFFQLPKDYFRPHSDVALFAELAWKEDGVMMVDADNFALCLTIWRLKEWLVNPVDNSYPLSCLFVDRINCRCLNLLHAMRTDDRLRKFISNEATFKGIDFDTCDYGHDFTENIRGLYSARWGIKGFAKKLITGEEMISRSNRAENVLSASQLLRMLEKLSSIIECFNATVRRLEDDW